MIGETLTVYSLLPAPASGLARDIVDGERLALREAGGRAGAFKVTFASLDETAGAEGDELPARSPPRRARPSPTRRSSR